MKPSILITVLGSLSPFILTTTLERRWGSPHKEAIGLATSHYCCSVAKSCLTLCNPTATAHQAPLSSSVSWSLFKFMSVGMMMLSNRHILTAFFSFDPASGSFPVNQLFKSGGQSVGASASASLLPMNIQGWFPLGLTGLISLQSTQWLIRGLGALFISGWLQSPSLQDTKLTSIS